MFIKYGDRRINLYSVQEYRPQDEKNYTILLKYIHGDSEMLYFFEKRDERDDFIKRLDEVCIKKLKSGIL